jgi:hypothetical protein
MRIHRHITSLAATITVIGAATPVAGASYPPNLAGSVGSPAGIHHTDPSGARFVPERVWQQINDAMSVKYLQRQ